VYTIMVNSNLYSGSYEQIDIENLMSAMELNPEPTDGLPYASPDVTYCEPFVLKQIANNPSTVNVGNSNVALSARYVVAGNFSTVHFLSANILVFPAEISKITFKRMPVYTEKRGYQYGSWIYDSLSISYDCNVAVSSVVGGNSFVINTMADYGVNGMQDGVFHSDKSGFSLSRYFDRGLNDDYQTFIFLHNRQPVVITRAEIMRKMKSSND
jgi:hypothetical protein